MSLHKQIREMAGTHTVQEMAPKLWHLDGPHPKWDKITQPVQQDFINRLAAAHNRIFKQR